MSVRSGLGTEMMFYERKPKNYSDLLYIFQEKRGREYLTQFSIFQVLLLCMKKNCRVPAEFCISRKLLDLL